jgi:hypothetical protein
VKGATGGVIGDTVIICGGYDGDDIVDKCYRLTSEETTFVTQMLVERQNAASIVLNDNILWVTGGWSGAYVGTGWSGAYLASTEYVTVSGTMLGPNLTQALTNHAMVAINKTCSMVIGGYSASTFFNEEPEQNQQNRTFFYDHNEGEWITGPSMMQARMSHAAGIVTDDVTDEPLVAVTGGITGGRNYSHGWFFLDSTEILQDGEWVQGKIIITIWHLLEMFWSRGLGLFKCRSKFFSFLPSLLRQNLDKSINPFQSLTDSNRLVDLNNTNKEFLPKKSSQKNPLKKSCQKTPPKKSKENPKNSPQKSPKKSQKKSKQFLKKFLILKISNSQHRNWRPKTLSGLFVSAIDPNSMPSSQ